MFGTNVLTVGEFEMQGEKEPYGNGFELKLSI